MIRPSEAKPPGLLRRLRYGLEHFALRSAVTLVPLLPAALLRPLAWLLGSLGWACDRRGRNTARMNLEAVFPGMTAPEQRRTAIASYRVFARTFIELFWSRRLIRMPREKWGRFFEVRCDSEAARAHLINGRCIFATAHAGNFEWLSICRASQATETDKMMIIAQDFKNPPLTEIFRELRSIAGQVIVPQQGAMLKMFKHLKRGGSVAALVDLNIKPEQSAAPVRSFDRWVSVSVLHAALAARTGVPIVPALCLPHPDGRWLCRFFDPIHVAEGDDPATVAQRCWDIFEPEIRACPAAWLWMYKHWRYLPDGVEPTLYPGYANRSKRFDRLLRETMNRLPPALPLP